MFKSEIKNYNLDIFIPNLVADLIGFASISLVFFFTLLIAIKWPAISKIILASFVVRVSIMLIGYYFFHLPDSTDDAIGFEVGAWNMAQEGFFNAIKSFPGMNSFFYSWIISFPYSLFGRSILMMQSIGIVFGLGSVFLGWYLSRKVWGDIVANRVGWVLAFFPSLVLYSVVTLREVYASFFLLVAIFGVLNWVKTTKYRYFISGLLGFIGAGFFHGALLIGGIILLIIFTYTNFKVFFRSFLNSRLHYKSFMVVILSSFILAAYFSGKIYIQYLGDFKTAISIERIKSTINVRMKGEATYPDWTKINSPVEVVYKIPVRSVYFLFSPFPWDIKKFSHIMGAIDGLIYLILVYFIF